MRQAPLPFSGSIASVCSYSHVSGANQKRLWPKNGCFIFSREWCKPKTVVTKKRFSTLSVYNDMAFTWVVRAICTEEVLTALVLAKNRFDWRRFSILSMNGRQGFSRHCCWPRTVVTVNDFYIVCEWPLWVAKVTCTAGILTVVFEASRPLEKGKGFKKIVNWKALSYRHKGESGVRLHGVFEEHVA